MSPLAIVFLLKVVAMLAAGLLGGFAWAGLDSYAALHLHDIEDRRHFYIGVCLILVVCAVMIGVGIWTGWPR